MQKYQTAAARILLALVFLGSVILGLMAITSTPGGYLKYQIGLGQLGLPSVSAPILILLQLVGGFSLLVGFKTQLFARILAVLAIFFAFLLGRSNPEALLLYLGVAGGMLLLSVHPFTTYSLDNRKKQND